MSFRIEDDQLTCKPLDTYNEIFMFLQNPPAWRSLCKKIKAHSKFAIKNNDIKKESHRNSRRLFEDGPETFCHFDPDAEEVKRRSAKRMPRTLVCHDMANGYHDDRFIDGTGNYDAYTFYNWAGIDIFCYFSHHLITIPPLGWINVGHAHGVKVIGTIITEWAVGMAFWDKVLVSEDEYKNFASALVAIAKTLNFDGWLLNVENKILKPDVLLEFVRHLHKIMHQELKEPLLIWYDSVTTEGHLNWQNALNVKNKAFFDVCDGFFTNYSWTEDDVESSAKEAGDRVKDLFIGIDVWGRNFFGGGQFNIQEAISVAYKNGCSLAIFAPAWTHEALTMDDGDINKIAMSDHLDKYEHFMLRDRALWDSIWIFLNTKLPCHLPFKTSFCRGQGKKRRLYGEVLCPVPWYNLRHMQYQPNSSHGPHGYLLSTRENIMTASRHSFLKESRSIIKQKEEPKSSNTDLQFIKSFEENDDGRALVSESLSGLVEETSVTRSIDDQAKLSSSGIKSKIKNVFNHIFRKKQSKPDETEDTSGRDQIMKQSEMKMSLETSQEHSNENKHPVTIKETPDVVLLDPVQEQGTDTPDYERETNEGGEQEYQLISDHEIRQDRNQQSMVQVSLNIQLKDTKQKTRYALAFLKEELPCLQVYFEDSFIGGSCLKINPSPEHLIRLFHCDFFCKDALIVCVVTKQLRGVEDQFLNLKFHMKASDDDDHRIVLIGRDLANTQQPDVGTSFFVNLYPIMQSGKEFKDIQNYLLLKEPDFYVPVENAYNWNVRYYEIHLPGSRVTSINCSTGLDKQAILLGHLGICRRIKTHPPE